MNICQQRLKDVTLSKALWIKADQKPYYYVAKNGIQELLGYNQTGGGLNFILILNSGHMVPIDQPAWALQIVKDFVQK